MHASDGNKLLSAGMDHTIKMWNLQGGLTTPSLPCNCLCMHTPLRQMPCELDIKAINEQHYFNQEQMYGQLYTASVS